MHPSVVMIQTIAKGLGDLVNKVVFIGGATTPAFSDLLLLMCLILPLPALLLRLVALPPLTPVTITAFRYRAVMPMSQAAYQLTWIS